MYEGPNPLVQPWKFWRSMPLGMRYFYCGVAGFVLGQVIHIVTVAVLT